ncbi:unnamed protein product [Effrenium voratum]|nr:unnamed protein product [Effrenium voratum]
MTAPLAFRLPFGPGQLSAHPRHRPDVLRPVPRPDRRVAFGTLSFVCAAWARRAMARKLQRQRRYQGCVAMHAKQEGHLPCWLGGGMQEIVSSFDTFVVAGEGTIHKDERVFPWAADCLQELKAAGKTVLLLCTTSELHPLGLSQQFDSVGDLQTLANKRVLVVGDSLHQMQSARAAGLACALVCSGQLSEAFQLSPAPRLDVPANGGHFVEPDGACWEGICGDAPDYALACFAFSEGFFFRFFAKRRAMAKLRHARK